MRRRRRDSGDEDTDAGSSKKRRTDVGEIETRLRSLITRVGEKSTSSLESNLEGLATVLEADMANYKSKIVNILLFCVTHMSEKLTVYSTLVGLINAKNYSVGGEFVELLIQALKDALKNCEFGDARYIVKFLADLVNCHVIDIASFLQLLDTFLSVTLEEGIPQVRSDWYVYTVMSTLPVVGHVLYEKKPKELEQLMKNFGTYLNKRQKVYLPMLRVWSTDTPHPQEEYLDSFWNQLRNLQDCNWQEKLIQRPYLTFDSILSEALQHNIPNLMIPSHNEQSMYPLPKVIFRMFDYTDSTEGLPLPGHHSIDKILLEDQLRGIIEASYLERKDCAELLVKHPASKKVAVPHLIVEIVFSDLFRLPRTEQIEVFYASVFLELCKQLPGSMPIILAQATQLLYERLDTMHTTVIDRFVTWFTMHLCNFQFKWDWDEWTDSITLDQHHPKHRFVKEVLVKCMRLSFHQRVVNLVPAEFTPMLPNKPVAVLKYESDPSLPGCALYKQLLDLLKDRPHADVVTEFIKNTAKSTTGDENEENLSKIDVFTHGLLSLGQKTFSHTFKVMARYVDVFKALAETPDSQIQILKSMNEVWHDHQQLTVILVDKLLKTQVVTCSVVANWLFNDMQADFTRMYVWEIMHSTIDKMNRHVTKIQDQLALMMKQKDTKQNSDDSDSDEEIIKTVTDEEMEDYQEKLEAAESDQKNLYLVIFQRFIMMLSEHLAHCEENGLDHNTFWYKDIVQRLQEVFLTHYQHVNKFIDTLENLLFTSDIDFHILEVFQQYCSLKS